jgi:hypothetical protein
MVARRRAIEGWLALVSVTPSAHIASELIAWMRRHNDENYMKCA